MAVIPSTGNKPMGQGLSFSGMTHLGISKGLDLQFSLLDKTAQAYLCVGREDNRILVTGTTPLSRQEAVLEAIDQLGSPGYGKQVCDAVGASQCDFEQVKGADLAARFKENSVPNGLYILFSEGHVLLYNSDINTLCEFTFGGFKRTPAGQRSLQAPRDLWWMRKLSEAYRPCFD